MHRESIYVCSYGFGEDEQIGHVRAWDDKEAAELFAREIELESDLGRVGPAEIRVRPTVLGRSELPAGSARSVDRH